MDIWQLHVFCKVIEEKSFSRAGQAIRLSQPTVSSHIKELEAHFDCSLLDRMGREVLPTKAGELLYGYARKLTRMRDEAEIAMSQFKGKTRGALLIGGSTIPGNYILPGIIGAFVRQYPEVRISLEIGDTEDIVQKTQSGLVEVGLVGAASNAKGIIQETLVDDDMRLIVPANHRWAGRKKILLSDLVGEPFIVRERGSGTLKSIDESMRAQGRSIEDLNIVAEMGSTTAVLQAIKNGVGVSILSAIAVRDDLKSGTLTALSVDPLDLKRCFFLTRHQKRSESPLCMEFVQFLKFNLLQHPCSRKRSP